MINELRQKRRFNRLSVMFPEVINSLNKLGSEPYIMPFWVNVNKKAQASFLPKPKHDFLANKAIIDTMFVVGDERWLKIQTDYLKKILGEDYELAVKEDWAGAPKLIPGRKTSHNSIHHMYHLFFFEKKTRKKLREIPTIVEWGGGYGSMSKLWRRNFNRTGTYIIIDTALFCSIQWLYLSTVLGENEVHLLKDDNSKIVPGIINIVPLALLDNVEIKGDLFISTWGLSESSTTAQDYVVKKKWFGAKHLLIGFQDSTPDLKHASRLGDITKKAGAQIIDIPFIPNNHYAIK